MITVEAFEATATGGRFSMYGKSTDEKPINKYMGMSIDNGSSFFEIDTQAVKFYDADTNTWI